MKIKYIFILLSVTIFSGCGVFVQKQQTYYLDLIDAKQIAQDKPYVQVQIVPSTKDFNIFLLYGSRKWIAPYSIQISSQSDMPVDSPILVHSIKLSIDSQILIDETYDDPMILKFEGPKKMGNYTYYEVDYLRELGDILEFREGSEVELELVLEHPGFFEKQKIKMKGVGKESKEIDSLWNAYMSV